MFAHCAPGFCFSLTKNYRERPKYKDLLKLPFMKKYETANVNVAEWYARAKEQCEVNLSCSSPVRR
jgi:mitogen-activated protein kinase kinase 7